MNDEMFEKGLKIRKEVLGVEYVEKSLANADDFTSPMQRLVSEYVGERFGVERNCRKKPEVC